MTQDHSGKVDSLQVGIEQPVDEAIAEYLQAQDDGESLNIDQWLERHPSVRDQLLEFLRDQRQTSDELAGAHQTAIKRRIERVDLEATTDFGSVDLQNQSDTPLSLVSGAEQAIKKIRTRGVPTSAPQVPATVAGIQLGRMLGSGGMGRVYEGMDASGQQVAVKLLSPDWSRSRESIERFRQEGAIASSINHPRCVFVRTADTDNGCPYIVMELMSGKTLKDLVKERGALQYPEALRLIMDIADGLQEAHSRGMIHRDVKPANCYLEDNGRVKVGDFGLARSMEQSSDLTTTGGFVGTPLYASPEPIRGAKLDSRTDVYSLCATLYFLLTGQAPFAADHPTQTIARIASEDPPSVREMVPSCPLAVDRILAKGLARDPAKRFESMEELKASIRPLIDAKMLVVTFGKRFGAICIDLGIYSCVTTVIVLAFTPDLLLQGVRNPWLNYGVLPFWFSYLCVLEKLKGSTPGKFLFRIKVVDRQTLELPSWTGASVRTLAYLGLSGFGTDILLDLFRPGQTDWLCFVLQGSGYAIGIAAMFSTVRLRNDRPLLHDWLSNTKVIERSQVAEETFLANIDPRPIEFASVARSFPAAFGRFQAKGCLVEGRSTAERPAPGETDSSSERTVFLAEDPSLGRQVWIVLDPRAQPIQDRREDRATRLRYLQSGDSELGRWDAFLAVDGASLTDWSMASGGLEWSAVRSILLQFCEECGVPKRNENACQSIKGLSSRRCPSTRKKSWTAWLAMRANATNRSTHCTMTCEGRKAWRQRLALNRE